ncbi:NAD-glutamate dehydrogenase [Saccharopolyspora erythraea]|uniref:NAD-glutamate dehydrogenase domain-containing protein n=1 Tax=Saccharopolyspora erythraea TaxID=1836 RepID=UPI001BACF3E0|nr:NAD-glutamate dehydrogenase domain-containing protein [Saccharopolyspora erythraea]QUH02526.1 NAD-glutamate dehydrogenase [Saccharopolyspora erythraea]
MHEGGPGDGPAPDVEAVTRRDDEQHPDELARHFARWRSELAERLAAEHGADGRRLLARYSGAFPAGYQYEVPVEWAVDDILRLEGPDTPLGTLYWDRQRPGDLVRFRIRWPAPAPLLQDVLPIFAGLGLRVADHRSYEIAPAGAGGARIDDFGLVHAAGALTPELATLFEETFAAMWHGRAEPDGFNELVLTVGVGWREAALVRAAYRYLRQSGFAFSQPYVEQAVADRPDFVRLLLEQFRARFDPDARDGPAAGELDAALEASLNEVTGLDEDKTLRSVLAFFRSVVRTNYYQRTDDGSPKDYLSFKIDPSGIPFVPRPRPLFETFVCSPRVEALHLRAARIARGGIRWSTRPEDFRTEVLGLMKAQTVKNALIVPGGAKGAFVVRRPLAGLSRAESEAEVRDCYATFIRGMLDITDNLVDGSVTGPPRVLRQDDPDPYLVVAADKGTARLSDLANSIAAEYGFWLDDAFASGGCTGYDHKAMGITARGAWVSLERHFEDMGLDPQHDEFTVVGIGDMSGDVFGNGMLLSRRIRLVGAFDHRHVFLDPDPDAETSYAERERLAALPGSTWHDYSRKLISEGGGVFSRQAKSVPLSPQVRRLLGVGAESLEPPELVRAMLRAPVDVIWNGGIGTYVKASAESHLDASDPANDSVRVDAGQLRCRTVVEGGNLGLTQRARIEYALGGGRINTDFIDNAAGVNTSDREVNLKILLNTAVADGEITRAQRDEILAANADDVARAVLEDSRLQTRVLGVVQADAAVYLDQHAQEIHNFERHGRLDRELESLPDDDGIAERRQAGIGLTRPEISVLLAHAKNAITTQLSESNVPGEQHLAEELVNYLPAALRSRFGPLMRRHPLRREILTTALSNDLANHVGTGFFYRLEETTGVSTPDSARAYLAVRDIFGLNALWSEVDALGARCPTEVRTEMLRELQRFSQHGTLWFLRNRRPPLDIAAEVEYFRPQIRQLVPVLAAALAGPQAEAVQRQSEELATAGVPFLLAGRIAALAPLAASLDVVEIAHDRRDVGYVASVYSALDAALRLDWLQDQIVELPSESHWALLAKISLRDDLFAQRRRLTSAALSRYVPGQDTEDLVHSWLGANDGPVRRCRETVAQLHRAGQLDVAMLSVALQDLRNLAQIGMQAEPETAAWGRR